MTRDGFIMLLSLHIKDFAIIDELEVEFGRGLTVMTGETGAGKTIVVEALKLILGGRAQADAIRAGSEKAGVTAVFDADGISAELKRVLADAGVEVGAELIIHRVIGSQAKGKIAVNGVPVTTALLKDVAWHLVDVSSQHEHQLLLDPANHGAVVDAFGSLEADARNYREAHGRWAALARELADLEANEKAAKDKFDFLKFQLGELKAANVKPGEDQAIEAERNRLKHAAQLEEKARAAEAALYGGEGAALEIVGRASQLIAQCAQVDPEAAKWGEALARARAELSDVARELSSYAERLESNPARFEDLDERLHLIRGLMRKHGGSIEVCLARKDAIEAELATIERYDDILAEKRGEIEALAAARREAAKHWGEERRKVAKKMGAAVASELSDLGMKKTEFVPRIEVRPEGRWDEGGPDLVEFLISPNVGEPLRPLVKIASGGELSRVMLAIKSALAGRARLASTSIFDEVDAGIGGAVAEVVGKKLKEVARARQVICITHLPQVAVHGDRHYRISKRVAGGRTVAAIDALATDKRVGEIARMLGGTRITDATLAHAREMLGQA